MKASALLLSLAAAATASASPLVKIAFGGKSGSPFHFTSTFSVQIEPKNVVDNNNQPTGGLAGTYGLFQYGINSHENVICYNLTLDGFTGQYSSPARTATHIHEGPAGRAGPPRIAFPNPEGPEGGRRTSLGCLRGPFTTGIMANNRDTGEGFHVRQIEQNPSGFFTDVHSSLALPGAARGQLNARKGC